VRVLIWDPKRIGHHEVWLRMLERTAPRDVVTTTEPAADGTRDRVDDRAALREAVGSEQPDAVLLADLGPFVERSWWRRIARQRIVAIDHRSAHLDALRGSLSRRKLRQAARIVRDRVHYEVLVRVNPDLQIVALNPNATSRGSRRLRRQHRWMPNPLNDLAAVECCRWPRGRFRIAVVGYLQRRKGLHSLVAAFGELPAAERGALELLVAGQPSPGYRARAEQLVERARGLGVEVTAVLRHLDDDEYAAAVRGADLVVLTYDGHFGGSGILVQAASVPDPPAVMISDTGWIAGEARLAGALVVPAGDAVAIASAIRHAQLGAGRPVRLHIASPEQAFAVVWSALRGSGDVERPLVATG